MFQKYRSTYLLSALVLLVMVFILVNGKTFSSSVSSLAQDMKVYCEKNLKTYGGSENCYAQEFNKLAEKKGPGFSFEVMEGLQKIDQDAKGCHLMAHGLGAGSFKREPLKWRELIQNMPTICNYGAIHGIIESYIGTLPEKSLSREVIPTICGTTPRADCNHIVGHLLLVETEADVNKALNLCDVFTERQQNAFCNSGVFMEYQTALNLIEHKLAPRSWLDWPSRLDELEKMCRSYDGFRAEGCWEEIVHVALVKFNNDPKKIFDFCSSSQSIVGAKKCKRHSIGIIGASKNFDLKLLKPMCALPQKGDETFEAECYPALVSSALSTIPSALPDAVAFCGGLKEEHKKDCFSMIGLMGRSGVLTNDQLNRACFAVPLNIQSYCSGRESSYSFAPIKSND